MKRKRLSQKIKQTLVGRISNDCEVVGLKEMVSDEMSGDWGEKKKSKNSFLKCYVLRGTDFQNAQNGILDTVPIRYITAISFKKRKPEAGDILIELSGGSKNQPTGRIFIIVNEILQKSKNRILFSNFVKKLKIDNSRCLPEYFYRYWQLLYNLRRTTIYEKQTTGIRNFKYREFIDNEQISLPSLPEQRKTVYVLDSIQGVVKVQDKIIERTKELKRSLMQKLFKEGTRGAKLKKTEIGEIPENWEVVKLGQECEVFSGFAFRSSDFVSEGVPIIKIGNLQSGTVVLDKRTSFYPEEKSKNERLSKYILSAGDVLIALTGATTGKTAVVSMNFSGSLLNQRVGKFNVLGDNLNLQFARYFFTSSHFQKKIWGNILQSAQGNVSPKQIEQIEIPLPPLPEQREIAEILQTVDEKIEIEQKKKTLYEELFKAMLNRLMTGKIKVNNIKL